VTGAQVNAGSARAGAGDTSGPASAAALGVRDIQVRFSGVVAVDGVCLEVRRGEMLGLIGPNGAGKTTLFDTICGLRPPDRGVVELSGQDVSRMSAVRRARLGLRRTFQRQQVFGGLSVEDNLLCASEWRGGGGGVTGDLVGWPGRRRREAARRGEIDATLEACGLTSVRRTPAGSLPIGRARMLELGRALVDDPSVLLLDEPTSGLGEDDMDRLTAIVERTKESGRCAVVLVEHDIGFVMEHADRVAVLVRGQVIAEGSPADVQRDEQVRAAYLG
jgi:ABC-type branched-subunit amino acid transport system ATPase component